MRFAKTRNTTRLKCCNGHEKWRWARPKCCACHENCNASSENVAKVLRLPHKTTFDTLQKTRLNVTKCHACHAKRSNETSETSKNDHLCRTYHRHGHTVLTRTVANGCGRLRTVADGCGQLRTVATTNATSCEHTLSPQTPRVKREPLLRIRENDRARVYVTPKWMSDWKSGHMSESLSDTCQNYVMIYVQLSVSMCCRKKMSENMS